jgi:hypothetical protein
MVITLKCKKCRQEKPIYEFFKTETCIQGYNEYCHSCIDKALQMYLYE